MRIPLAIATVLILGCGQESGTEPKDSTGLATVYFDITGAVFDSVTSLPAAGLRLAVGDSVVTTSPEGTFHLRHPSGPGLITTGDLRFEPLRMPYAFDHNANVTLLLRGEAPYAFRCQFNGNAVTATVVDLQGRKTMDRRTRTLLTALVNQETVLRTGDKWFWTPLDDITWSATIVLPDSSFPSVEWRLEDLDGNTRTSSCDRSEHCTECQGPQ